MFSRARLLAAAALLGLAGSASAAEPFSIVVLPDTQYYTVSTSYDLYDRQMLWIANNKVSRNIKFVIHLGDMTNDNTNAQWATARAAYDILDGTGIPYSVLPGNHDYKGATAGLEWAQVAFRDLTKYNANFGPQKFAGKTWYGGNKGNSATDNANNYCYFEVGDQKFMVVSLEFCPRKDTMTWANNLIAANPDRRVIVATHGYLTTNGSYMGSYENDYALVGAGGSDLWNELVSRHSNMLMAMCGHVTESVMNTKTGWGGNTIREMLVDYQSESPKNQASPNLGNGWLRVLEFDPDTNTVDASTISVAAGDSNVFTGGTASFYESVYAASYTAADHLFSFSYDAAPLGPYAYVNGATNIHDFTINATGGGDQQDCDIAQADGNGRFVSVWEDDSDSNGVFVIRGRGFDSDGNANLSEFIVNSLSQNTLSATNPSIAMAADGRFAVAFQTSNTDVRVRVYNANGTPNGAEFTVPTVAGGTKRAPDVGMADNGDFIVTWEDDADGNGSYQIRARGFLANKSQKWAEKTVNSVATGQQYAPVIGVAANGDYVIAWQDDQNDDAVYEIAARGWLANETQRFAQIFCHATLTGQQRDPDIAIDDTGRFIVAWEDDSDSNGSYQVRARGFTATGTQLWAERTVNAVATGDQTNPSVAMEPTGNAYVVWQDTYTGEGAQLMTQGISTAGANLLGTSDIRANSGESVTHQMGAPFRADPAIAVHKSGRYVVAWTDDTDGNGGMQICGRGLTGLAKALAIKSVNGTVTRSVNEAFYKPNQTLTLTATPAANYTFQRWYGDITAGQETTNPLPVTMNATKRIQASFVTTTPPPADVIVDNVAPNFTASTNWTAGTSTAGFYGTNYQFRSTAAISDLATWNVPLTQTGNYKVYARWTSGTNRSATAPFQITHNGGTTTVNSNQQTNNGTWVLLGTYNFNSGTAARVKLSCWTTTGFVVVADAVKFEWVP